MRNNRPATEASKITTGEYDVRCPLFMLTGEVAAPVGAVPVAVVLPVVEREIVPDIMPGWFIAEVEFASPVMWPDGALVVELDEETAPLDEALESLELPEADGVVEVDGVDEVVVVQAARPVMGN